MMADTTEKDVVGDDGDGKDAKYKDGSIISSNKEDGRTPKANLEEKEETEEHPRGFAFAMIMASVLSSLFLVALVIHSMHLANPTPRPRTDELLRTEQSSLPPSQSSQTASTRWVMSLGTPEAISSAAARRSCYGVESTSFTAPKPSSCCPSSSLRSAPLYAVQRRRQSPLSSVEPLLALAPPRSILAPP